MPHPVFHPQVHHWWVTAVGCNLTFVEGMMSDMPLFLFQPSFYRGVRITHLGLAGSGKWSVEI